MSTETTNTTKASNIVSIEKVKNACFGAKTSLPTFCQGYAQESLSTTDDFSEAERQFDCTDALLKISEAQAKQEVKQAKLNAMLVKQQLQKGDNLHMITAFMRLNGDVPTDKQRAVIAVMIRQFSPGKPANAKDLGALATARVEGVAGWFARDKVFGLLVNLGLIVPKEGAQGYLWAELQPRSKQVRDIATDLCKRAVTPAFPDLYDEQRKHAAALKANQLAKQRADLVRQTAALVASTDTAIIDQRQSNTKVIFAGVAAALFFGGVLVAKYGNAPQPQAENTAQYETAPLFDVEKMLRENNPQFDNLPLSQQEKMIKEATAAFNEN